MTSGLSDNCGELLQLQHGVVARWQARGAGIDPALIDAQLRQRRWQPVYRGVYAAFTGQPPRPSLLWAAVLRAGPGAALSYRSAAELDGLASGAGSAGGAIHVTVPAQRQVAEPEPGPGHAVPRITIHRSARLPAAMHPVKSPPRTRIEETVLDLTEAAGQFDEALSWVVAACSRGLTTQAALAMAMRSRSRLRWRSELTGALDEVGRGAHSLLEFRYVRRVERVHGLPAARRQAKMSLRSRSQYLDNLYEEFGVAVELDGRIAHRTEDRWRDLHRDNYFAGEGVVTLRYGWTDVSDRPCLVAAEVGRVLGRRGWVGPLARCGPACRA